MTPTRHTVLHLVNRLDGGGVLRHILDLADGLSDYGFNSRIAAWAPEHAALHRDSRFTFLPLYTPRGRKRAIGMLRSVFRLRHLAAQERVSILHTHSRYALLLGQNVASAKPHVYTVHNLFADDRALDLIPENVIVPSSALQDSVGNTTAKGWQRDVYVIPHGVEIPPIPTGTREKAQAVFAWVGRIEESKGLGIVIDAMCMLRERGVDACALEIYGDGSLRETLQQRVDAVGMHGSIRFHGWVDAPLDQTANVNALVFSSLALDALGYVNLDAMARGIPVIASDLRTVDDLVIHGQAGLRYPRLDASALADTMLWAIQNPGSMRDLGNAGRAHVAENYTLQQMCERTVAVYESLLT